VGQRSAAKVGQPIPTELSIRVDRPVEYKKENEVTAKPKNKKAKKKAGTDYRPTNEPSTCYECSVVENSKADKKLAVFDTMQPLFSVVPRAMWGDKWNFR